MSSKLFSSIPLNAPLEIVEVGPLKANPLISKVRIKIAYHGSNQNGSYISKDTLTSMASRSLALTPIVGRYIGEIDDFGDHSIKSIITEDGEIGRVRYTKVFGVVPEQPNAVWEQYQEQTGEVKEYLVCDGYLYSGRYPETLRVIQEGNNHQSMEIDPATVVGKWSQVPNSSDMAFVITEANFLGLCILGADVEPCFEGATLEPVMNFSAETTNSLALGRALEYESKKASKEMGDFMKELEFALNHDPSVVSVEKMDNEEHLENVQSAITDLDIAADTEPNPVSVEAIDNAIDKLLVVETKLDREDVIVPNTEQASEALEEMAGGVDDITSSPNFDSKATSITKPFKEEETMPLQDDLLNTAEKPVVEPAVAPAAPAAPVAPAPVAPAAEPAPAIQRVSAEEKRQAMAAPAAGGVQESLSSKMSEILQAIQEVDQLKAALQELAGTVPTEAPVDPQEKSEGEVAPEGEKPAEDKEPKKEAPEAPVGEPAVDPEEEKKKKAPVFDKEDKEDEEKTQSVPGNTGDIAIEKDKGDDEDKKKEFENLGHLSQDRAEEGKPAAVGTIMSPTDSGVKEGEMTSTDIGVKQGEMTPAAPPAAAVSKNIESYQATIVDLTRELEFMRNENKELKAFKAEAELKAKESVLNEFAQIPEEEKARLRENFSNFSVADLEAQCALSLYRLGGQNSAVEGNIVSYSHESTNSGSLAELSLVEALNKFSK